MILITQSITEIPPVANTGNYPNTGTTTDPVATNQVAPPNNNSSSNLTTNVMQNNDKPHVVFQDEHDHFVPMNPNAVPFYKRARGCNSAEIKEIERAAALDEAADNGKPPRWAYQLAPYIP